MICTTSEDQTAKIWSILSPHKPHLIQELKRHKLAITSVDWKKMKNLGKVLAVCSDDKIIRVYKEETGSNEYKIFCELDISFIQGFFTLTYLSLENVIYLLTQIGSRVFCVTQMGHLLIYDLEEQKFEFQEKIHLGGIESLCVDSENNRVLTCSSDNCVHITHY